ncbi:MAG: energy-coupling factor transporter transmembrane protein EcfT [Defluviitaleaceae bacterium]|nr:energy-coupling factor transporter transmembrane protein EcfT [Defluviitaleaceae bacterium]
MRAGGTKTGLSYIDKNTPVHRLTGASKLLMVLFLSLSAMITFDTRLLAIIVVLSFILFVVSRVPLREMKMIAGFLVFILAMNTIITYLFAPEEGVRIYGTRTEIFHIIGRYYITQEQLFYQFNQTLKYLAILPLALIFFVTTEPSEFAASLNKIGVNYKIAYSVTLALRYIPTVMREYREISQAQQARGVDLSKNVKITTRVRGMVSIMFPLIITSIDRIDRIANAMELRSFGKNKTRTWYQSRPFKKVDYFVITLSALLIVAAIVMGIINGGRFLNPFV